MSRNRLCIVDLWKFIASVLIMVHHLYVFGDPFTEEYYGRYAWIFVEFFFILTGFFTYRHFRKAQSDNVFESGLTYTFHKFKPFLPYTTIAITLQYLVSTPVFSSKQEIAGHFLNYPFELLLIGEAIQSMQLLAPIWFLSAMLLVFPLIALLCQLKNKYLVLLVSILFPLFYYAQVSFGNRVWPDDILRALAGMMLGVFLCIVVDLIEEKRWLTKQPSIIVSIVEVSCMLFPFVVGIFNFRSFSKWIVLSFVLGIGAMLSGYSFTSGLNSKFVSYLGKISMPMFIWHWLVATIINKACHFFFMPLPIKLVLYFGGTILISVISYSIIENARKKRSKKKQI